MNKTEIDLITPLRYITDHGKYAIRLPQEADEFKGRLRNELLASGEWIELYGGHRNFVIRQINPTQAEDVRIYWRSHEIRWHGIIKALLTEHVVSTEFNIPGRQLINPFRKT